MRSYIDEFMEALYDNNIIKLNNLMNDPQARKTIQEDIHSFRNAHTILQTLKTYIARDLKNQTGQDL